MKKLVYKSILILIVFIAGSACNEDEYLEVINKNQFALSSFYQNANDAWKAMNTCYNPLAFSQMFGRNSFLILGSFDDRVLFESTYLDEFAINSGNGFTGDMFFALYVGLWRCSSVILDLKTKGPEIADLKEETRNNYIAQLKTLRAAYYFYLVTLFNSPYFYSDENLPLDYLASYGNSDPLLFWEQIEKDLTEALPDLQDKSEQLPEDIGRMTKGAAQAMLGKALLFKHYHYYVKNGMGGSADDRADLQLAKNSLNAVIASPTYALIRPQAPKTRKDYLYAFGSNFSYLDLPAGPNTYPAENNAESVWEIQYNDEYSENNYLPGWLCTGNMYVQYFSGHEASFKNHEVHPQLFYAYETTGVPPGFDRDPRAYASMYVDGDSMDFRPGADYYKAFNGDENTKGIAQARKLTVAGQPSAAFGMKKYCFPLFYEGLNNPPENAPVNIRLIRLSDVKLLFAEVTFLLNEDVGLGLAQLNDVRLRVDMPPVPELTAAAIMHERDVELATEGHRFLDLVRWSFDPQWGIDWNAIYGGSYFVVGKNEYLPIPIKEINKNQGALKQNPGW